MVMLMLMHLFMVGLLVIRMRMFRAMASYIIDVLSICWSGVVLGHGLARGLGRD